MNIVISCVAISDWVQFLFYFVTPENVSAFPSVCLFFSLSPCCCQNLETTISKVFQLLFPDNFFSLQSDISFIILVLGIVRVYGVKLLCNGYTKAHYTTETLHTVCTVCMIT